MFHTLSTEAFWERACLKIKNPKKKNRLTVDDKAMLVSTLFFAANNHDNWARCSTLSVSANFYVLFIFNDAVKLTASQKKLQLEPDPAERRTLRLQPHSTHPPPRAPTHIHFQSATCQSGTSLAAAPPQEPAPPGPNGTRCGSRFAPPTARKPQFPWEAPPPHQLPVRQIFWSPTASNL